MRSETTLPAISRLVATTRAALVRAGVGEHNPLSRVAAIPNRAQTQRVVPDLPYGAALFSSYVAVLDIALVFLIFLIFKGATWH
jgi:hypothetical protein